MTKTNLLTLAAKIAPAVFYGLLAIFLVVYLTKINYSQFATIHWNLQFIVLATLFGLAMRFWQVLIWINLLFNLGAKRLKENISQLTFVYAKSWLGRYIPGTAPWILGKIFFASRLGISKSKLAISSLLEGVLQIAVVMVVSLTILVCINPPHSLNTMMPFLIVALILCIVGVLPPVFNRAIAFTYKFIRKNTLNPEHLVTNKALFQAAALYVISALLSGTALFFIAKAIDPTLSFSNLLYVIGVSNLAGALGMIAIFAPSGIGVRDGIILALLSAILKPEYALVITVAARLWDVVIDLLFVGIAKVFLNRNGVVKNN
ncbi:MAG TPA: lysylphosphatidylglycerol synthase domain-containing protein [Candidatus Saccharimonadales bacterium]